MFNMTALTLSAKCIKYLLFLFNLLFVITGIIILSVGATVHGIYTSYEFILDDGYLSTSAFLVAIGLIIFIIAFFGCCGAVKENFCMIVTFSALLILIFIFELSAGISGYVLRDKTSDVLRETLIHRMDQYGKNDNNTIRLFDSLQSTFECCGASNYTDWFHTALNITEVPSSCCGPQYGTYNVTICDQNQKSFYKTPCMEAFGDFIRSHAVTLGGVAIGLAIIQLIGIVFSCHLSKTIKKNYESV